MLKFAILYWVNMIFLRMSIYLFLVILVLIWGETVYIITQQLNLNNVREFLN